MTDAAPLKEVRYLCCGCRGVYSIKLLASEVPRRVLQRTCPLCNKYRKQHIAGPRPLTRRDVK